MEEHSTIYYDLRGLVLRRGQAFSFTITFDQNLDVDQSQLSIIFRSDTCLKFIPIKIPIDGTSNGWTTKRLSTADEKKNQLRLEIHSPADAFIGKYSVCRKREGVGHRVS